MLATAGAGPRRGGGWLYEPRLSGVRALAYVGGGAIQLFGAERQPLDAVYPELVDGLALAVRGHAVLDGIVLAREPGRRWPSRPTLYLFDCLHYEGIDLTRLPLTDRKSVLRDVVWFDGVIRFTPFAARLAAACRAASARGMRRLVAKRATSRYVSGQSAEWVEFAFAPAAVIPLAPADGQPRQSAPTAAKSGPPGAAAGPSGDPPAVA
jgi:ATP-dependent DNA ligase